MKIHFEIFSLFMNCIYADGKTDEFARGTFGQEHNPLEEDIKSALELVHQQLMKKISTVPVLDPFFVQHISVDSTTENTL